MSRLHYHKYESAIVGLLIASNALDVWKKEGKIGNCDGVPIVTSIDIQAPEFSLEVHAFSAYLDDLYLLVMVICGEDK